MKWDIYGIEIKENVSKFEFDNIFCKIVIIICVVFYCIYNCILSVN